MGAFCRVHYTRRTSRPMASLYAATVRLRRAWSSSTTPVRPRCWLAGCQDGRVGGRAGRLVGRVGRQAGGWVGGWVGGSGSQTRTGHGGGFSPNTHLTNTQGLRGRLGIQRPSSENPPNRELSGELPNAIRT
jgi:hypothetical protein